MRYQASNTILEPETPGDDSLEIITGGKDGDMLVIRAARDGRDIRVKSDVGNIRCGQDIILSGDGRGLVLLCDGENWLRLGGTDSFSIQ